MTDPADHDDASDGQDWPDAPKGVMASLGPGLVTGAADDDPSGIATYSQVGAQFGYALGWTMVLGYPLMAAIQEICARIGATTGRGIADNLRRHYPRPLLHAMVVLLLVANVINLGSDLGAMGEAVALLAPGPAIAYTCGLALIAFVLEATIAYRRYVRVLKWACLSLFAYVGVAMIVPLSARDVLAGLFVPHVTLSTGYAMALVAVFGTTISPYLFFWQAAQEVEEQHRRGSHPLHTAPRRAASELRRIRTDTLVGMGFSNLVAIFIIVATAATLHVHGVTQINSAAQAAEALRPIAGRLAFALFTLGILGTGMLAVPVLAGSAAYAVAETFGWREGLDRKPQEARAFYAVIALATAGGVALNLLHIDPMKALYWSAVINGLLAPPLMVVTMLIARNPRIMGHLTVPPVLTALGWLATAVMTIVGVIFLAS